MKLNDAVIGLIVAALGAAILLAIQSFPKIPGQPVGPALFPGLIAVGLCITGAVLVVKGWRLRAQARWLAWDDWIRSPRHLLAFGVLVGGIVFYIAGAPVLGFLPTAFLLLCALFAVLRVPRWRIVPIALVITLLVHYAFYKLLRVPLPWGMLKDWAW